MSKNGKIQFLGATRTVTGSSTLVEFSGAKVLVDCGMFQGPKDIRALNEDLYGKELAQSLDAVILTHAHVDHSALIPKIYQLGFRGKVYCTEGTKRLSEILLPDTAYLQEEDARRRSHNGGKRQEPLYSVQEANNSLKLFQTVKRHQWVSIAEGFSFRFLRAGHILGASVAQLSVNKGNGVKLITFSGDLGNGRQNVIKGPVELKETDDLVLESTYGDRLHKRSAPEDDLEVYINQIVKNKGVLVIPSFAVGRTQELLYLIKSLEDQKRIPVLPVFLDSPMAIEATDLYMREEGELKLDFTNGNGKSPLAPSKFSRTRKVEESQNLMKKDGPLIIISAAGMLTGGRILYHLKERLLHKENVILFVGYQAEGTKGRLLQNGLGNIRLHGDNIPVNAQVATIESLSAHADSDDLVDWVSRMERLPKRVFINHGEKQSANALAYRLKYELGLEVFVPRPMEEFDLI